jgi:hypothetical protein
MVNRVESFPGASNSDMRRSESQVWRTMMEAASRVNRYYAGKAEGRARAQWADQSEPPAGQDKSAQAPVLS